MDSELLKQTAAKVFIVDGHALAYRMFHALPEMKSPAGAPSNAIFGFIKSLRRAVETYHPTHGAVVWDGGLSSKRLALLPEYKGQRPPMPDALRSQLTPLQEWVALMGWPCLCQQGVEADDIIGTLAHACESAGAEVLVMSPDKDFMQIVTEKVHLWRVHGKVEERVTPAVVQATTGVHPDQVVDWLSLIGDSSDNIAGAPGVGPKTATKVLVEFGSISAIFRQIELVKPERLRNTLRENRNVLERNQELVRLSQQPQCILPLEKMRVGEPDTGRVTKFLGDWGLKSLLHEWQQGPPMIQAELF